MTGAPAARRGRSALVLLAVLATAAGAARSGRTEDPPRPWSNAPERFTLATGVPCIYQKDPVSPITVVGLFIGGGKSAVPSGLDGLAAISTRLLLEIPDESKIQDLMGQATRLSYVCLEDSSIVLIECLTEHLEEALPLAGKIVQDPLISGLRVNRAKDLMKANGKADEDDPVTVGRNAVFETFFGGAGYGSDLYGTESSLKVIDRKDIVSFVRRFTVKPNVFFCVETDLDREVIGRLLEKSFAGFPAAAVADIPRQDPVLPVDRDISRERETKQAYVGRAYALPRAGLHDMARGDLLETLLGKGPGSRLWALREDERLAYSVDADLTWMKSGGLLIAYLETGRARGAEAAAALDRTLESLREKGVTAEELEATRTMARARFLRGTEAKSPRLRTLGLSETLGLGAGSAAALLEAFNAVKIEEMNAFIREVLDPARALRVTVGPAPAEPAGR
ncbi:MAG: M16 family metallopeptidase [Candidatus Aminicenantales bacterium]